MRYICTSHRPETLICHYTSFMSSSRQRRVNNDDVCDQKQHFSKCSLRHDEVVNSWHTALPSYHKPTPWSKKNKALHSPHNVQGPRANEATGQTPLYRACCPCSRRQGRIQKAVAPSGPHFANGITEYLHITAQIVVSLDNKVEMVWSCCHHGNKERGNSLMWMVKETVADDPRQGNV
jgi:hypothetical protein